ncbi:SMI1/KNR4 family protein [Veillonella sp.]|uniref:SMI1/KNR4 family protein n=1 Tax=Veillonella sp. TaxID=1926307 RepID=UPI0012BA9E4B|nr:SMI1/KNR4 family protein [Veillonella sp.]MDU2300508.1 SMI1/KNR4 family protein [Veillonella sp.]MDU2387354.1 SMI1/KNR4 family protein [Veillonella sp.]MTH32029.1 SMI1/KNR4 family protein [Veillonella dispar]
MSNLKDFDWTGFWNDVDYAFESYIGKPVTDKDIKAAEADLGYTLPAAYIELLKNHNGGVVKKNCFINDDGDCVYVTGIYGIDRDKKYSLLGEMGNKFWISKVKYPPIGVVVADTISGGHDMIFLDYRECGPTGEPKVVRVDQEGDYSITPLADNFGDFIKNLYISIEDITDEEFQELSDADKVKLLNEQEDLDIDRAMELLTNIGIDNLSPILLSTLGRMYNNNGRAAEAIDLFNRIDETQRDWSWYYRCGYAHATLAIGESYESEHVQKALQLIEAGMKMTKEAQLDKQLGWCCEVVKYLLTQIKPKEYKTDYPVIFETIENFYDNKNSKKTTEDNHIEDANEYEEDNYPTYDVVHWVFNKQTYSREEFSKEYNENVKRYIYDDQSDDDDRLEEPEILVTYEAWIESEDQLFDNERVTDEELLEEDKEDGMWQVEIMAHLVADNGTYFTREELLFKLHNLMANKELGDHVFFEGIEYEGHECEGYGLIDNEDGIPVFYICCGS